MRMLRPVAVLALTLGSVALSGSHAATPPPCNLITDPAGDTFMVRSQDTAGAYGPQEDGLDLRSVDVASDDKVLTGVIRVTKLATAVASAPNGIDFRISFLLPGQDPAKGNLFLNARTVSGTPSFLLGSRTIVAQGQSLTAKLADATGTFDMAKNEIRLTVPLAAVKAGDTGLKKGDKITFTGLDQTAARQVAINPSTGIGTATFADVVQADVTYVAGSKNCVKPGA